MVSLIGNFVVLCCDKVSSWLRASQEDDIEEGVKVLAICLKTAGDTNKLNQGKPGLVVYVAWLSLMAICLVFLCLSLLAVCGLLFAGYFIIPLCDASPQNVSHKGIDAHNGDNREDEVHVGGWTESGGDSGPDWSEQEDSVTLREGLEEGEGEGEASEEVCRFPLARSTLRHRRLGRRVDGLGH